MDYKQELVQHAHDTGYLEMNMVRHIQMLKSSFKNMRFQRGELTGGTLVLKHMIMHQLGQSPRIDYFDDQKGYRERAIKALIELERILHGTQDSKCIDAELSIVATAATFLDVPAVECYRDTHYWKVMDEYQEMQQAVSDKMGFGYTPANLRALLKQHDLTVIAAAELIGVTPNHFHRYLKDPDSPFFSTMQHHRWLQFLEEVSKL